MQGRVYCLGSTVACVAMPHPKNILWPPLSPPKYVYKAKNGLTD